MKTRLLIVGIIILISGSTLSILGLIAGQELNNQGNTDVFPDDWGVVYDPSIGYVFAWITIIFIPVSIIGMAVILYGIFSKFAKQIAVGIGISLLVIYVGIIVMGYPYT